MDSVLVTGASGFIGLHLVELLRRRGDRVACLVRRSSNTERLAPLGVDLVYGDVTDRPSVAAAVAGKSAVYHLAGLVKALSPGDLYRVNEQGVSNVASACAERSEPPVLVVVSSLAAAGPSPAGRHRSEADPPQPVSNYGRSKRAGEEAATAWAGQVPISVVRPPIVFGEGDPASLEMFLAIQRFRTHFVPGLRPRQFSVIHAADLAELLVRVGQRGERLRGGAFPQADGGQGYYHAAGDEHPSYSEFGRRMALAMGVRHVVCLPCTRATVRLAAGISELAARLRRRAAYFSVDKSREALAGSWTCSAEKAARQLDFQVAAPLDARLRQTVEWYRRHGWLK